MDWVQSACFKTECEDNQFLNYLECPRYLEELFGSNMKKPEWGDEKDDKIKYSV